MEATGSSDGGAGVPSWHVGTGSSSYTISSSSRSGTIVSTAYTSGASRNSSSISMQLGTPDEKETTMKHIESLVQEFFREPFIFLGGSGGGMSALERWFSKLGVSWVLHLGLVLMHDIGGWIKALKQIMETIRLTESFFADHGQGFVGMPTIAIGEEEVESGKQAATGLDLAVQFALFFQEAMSKMLVFVDVMFSNPLSAIRGPAYYLSFRSYLHIFGALSETLSVFRLQFHSSPPAEVEKIEKEMVSLLSAKQGKAFEAIWSALEEIKTHALKSMEEYSSDTQTLQESSDIHKATRSVMNHINFLLYNESTFAPIVSQAASLGKYVPHTGPGEATPFISLLTETVSPLQEFLFTKSQFIPNQGLRFLFLLNNSNYIRKRATEASLTFIQVLEIVTRRKDELRQFIESYIQVSWAPMLSCLSNPTPLCFGINHSPLSKFEYEFQKTYTAQKLWKVPDPILRKELCREVTKKIIPGYTKYIEDSKVTNPKITPQKLEEMLQELFEG